MNEDKSIALVAILGALVLVSAALTRRRLPAGKAVRMAMLWAGIFVLAWAAANFAIHLQR